MTENDSDLNKQMILKYSSKKLDLDSATKNTINRNKELVVFTRYANWLTTKEFSFIVNLIATKNNIDTKNENAMKRFEKQHFPYGKRFNSISNINSKGYFAVTIYHTPYIIVMHHKEKSENAYILSLQGSWDDYSHYSIVAGNIKRLGWTEPTLIQRVLINVITQGHNIIGLAQTGSGKTAAYLIPIIVKLVEANRVQDKERNPSVLVLSPIRELSQQIVEHFEKLSPNKTLVALAIIGGKNISEQFCNMLQGVDLISATPGRLLDFLSRSYITFSACDTIVIDEADEMLNLNFFDDIDKIFASVNEDSQIIMISATFADKLLNLATSYFKKPIIFQITADNTGKTKIQEKFIQVSTNEKYYALQDILKNEIKKTLLFVNKKHIASKLSASLSNNFGFVLCIHGGKPQEVRESILSSFKNSQNSILITTDVMGRGIDIVDIDIVINYELPPTFEIYLHRIGRTGRAGRSGTAITFYDPVVDHEELPKFKERIKKFDSLHTQTNNFSNDLILE
uniref:Eukaryotic initiation factor 4A-like n=1 Tax=Dermatophagoides pteronyssinus TaxID=6956 RepID=A0A6P6YDA5_DERPT|nr:eukaryotic initiation factor 4A-like [Dermatophagoides pteronyssinus]